MTTRSSTGCSTSDERRRSALTSLSHCARSEKNVGSRCPGPRETSAARCRAGEGPRGAGETAGGRGDDAGGRARRAAPDCAQHRGGGRPSRRRGRLRRHREVRREAFFDFEPKDHLELGELLRRHRHGARAKVSAPRFFTSRAGAGSSSACSTSAMQQAIRERLHPMITRLVKPEAMAAPASRLPRARGVPAGGRRPVPGRTSECLSRLSQRGDPRRQVAARRYAGWSSLLPAAGRLVRQRTRGHPSASPVSKGEMFSYVRPEDAHDEHLRLLNWEKEMLAKVELPYRVIRRGPRADLGASAPRKYDCEAWSRPRAAIAS